MERIAYIQLGEDGRSYGVNAFIAAKGFAALGYELRYFRRDQLPVFPLTPKTVVAGSMAIMHAALGGRATRMLP